MQDKTRGVNDSSPSSTTTSHKRRRLAQFTHTTSTNFTHFISNSSRDYLNGSYLKLRTSSGWNRASSCGCLWSALTVSILAKSTSSIREQACCCSAPTALLAVREYHRTTVYILRRGFPSPLPRLLQDLATGHMSTLAYVHNKRQDTAIIAKKEDDP